jgi:hypothetical protein
LESDISCYKKYKRQLIKTTYRLVMLMPRTS